MQELHLYKNGIVLQYLSLDLVPPRAGAFSANFTPEILDRFRELCKQQSKSYSKVMERLAEIYLETDGAVLDSPFVPTPKKESNGSNEPVLLQEMQKRLEQLESDYKNADDHLEALIECIMDRLEILEK